MQRLCLILLFCAIAPLTARADDPATAPATTQSAGAVDIFGLKSSNVDSVIFVCDASGSMNTKFDPLKAELIRSISNLSENQSFNVIFFQEKAFCLNKDVMIHKTRENLEKTIGFINSQSATDATNTIPALEIAFKQKPKVIYLLTDGDFPDNEAVIDFINKNNTNQVKINTVAYIDHSENYEKVMHTIADMTGGKYNFVSEKEVLEDNSR
jgi:hypothetical protein